jgi:hypothetical protein
MTAALSQRSGGTRLLPADLGVDRVPVTRWEGGQRFPRRRSCVEYAALLERLAKEVNA